MDLAKAIAVYLYEQGHPPGSRDERLMQAAWQVIASCGEAAREHEAAKPKNFR